MLPTLTSASATSCIAQRNPTRQSPNTVRPSGSSPTLATPTSTLVTPFKIRQSSTRQSPLTAKQSDSSPMMPWLISTLASPFTIKQSSIEAVATLPRGHPTEARRRQIPLQPWLCPSRPRQAPRGSRRLPRSHPAQTRLCRGLLQPRRQPARPGQERRGRRRLPRSRAVSTPISTKNPENRAACSTRHRKHNQIVSG